MLAHQVINSFDISVVKVALINAVQPNHILLANLDVVKDIYNKRMSYRMRKHECPSQAFSHIQKYTQRGFILVKMELASCGELIPQRDQPDGLAKGISPTNNHPPAKLVPGNVNVLLWKGACNRCLPC